MKKILALALLLTSSVFASTITLTSVNGLSDGHYYIGPYTLTVDGTKYAAMCYDFGDEVLISQTWDADVKTIDALNDSYFNDRTKYEEVAWLFNQLDEDRLNVQYAAWGIFDPNAPQTLISNQWIAAAQNAAANNFFGMPFGSYRFIESAEAPRVQAFIIAVAPSTVTVEQVAPEPMALVLIGSSLIFLALLGRKLKRAR